MTPPLPRALLILSSAPLTHSHEQQRFARKLLRHLAPAERRLSTSATAAAAASAAAAAPSHAPGGLSATVPHLLHDRPRRRTVPHPLRAFLRVEPAQQKLAIRRVVRETPAEADAEHDAAQDRPRDAAAAPARPRGARRHALQTLDRLAHGVADFGARGVLAGYDGVEVHAGRRAEYLGRQTPFCR